MTESAERYTVGLTADGADSSGHTIFGDIHLERLTEQGIDWRLMPKPQGHSDATVLAGLDAVLSFGHMPFDAELVRAAPRLRHVARFGAGFDGIDPDALAREGVIVTTTPEAVRKPLALSGVTFVLALAHRLLENDRVATADDWSQRGKHRGIGLNGRTVGVVGFGNVGSQVATYLAGLGAKIIATGRSSSRARAQKAGIEFVTIQDLAERSDFVVVTAALTDQTHRMLGADFFEAMQSHAYFINIARGGIVDQEALTEALRAGTIAGAGLDVFDPEPPASTDPLLSMPNVILSPHALCWTADFTRDVSASVIDSIVSAAHGTIPATALSQKSLDPLTWRGANSDRS